MLLDTYHKGNKWNHFCGNDCSVNLATCNNDASLLNTYEDA